MKLGQHEGCVETKCMCTRITFVMNYTYTIGIATLNMLRISKTLVSDHLCVFDPIY